MAVRSTRLVYPISSDEDVRARSPPREKRNFIDLTREEMIQDDVEGWDIEEDLIDRMLNWGGGGSNRRAQIKSRRWKGKRSQLPTTTKKRKRQRRIDEFTIPASTITTCPPRKRGPKLSIVDACDIYKSEARRSPPQFMRVARRQGQRAKNFGRRRPPIPSRFSFAEEEDQKDVHTVITEWENGAIADGLEQRVWVRPARRPDKMNLSTGSSSRRAFGIGPQKTRIRRTPLARLHDDDNVAADDDVNQYKVNKFILPRAPIVAIVDGRMFGGRFLQNKTAYTTGIADGVTTGHVPKRFPGRPNDIAIWLQQSKALNQIPDEEVGFTEITDRFKLPGPPVRARVRKLKQPVRRDINKFNKRFCPETQVKTGNATARQLSLDGIWFPNDSTSLTFGVIAMTEGMYLDSSTLVGKRLLSIALNTKPALESESLLWIDHQRQQPVDVGAACEEFAASLDQIVDSIDKISLSDSQDGSINTVHRQILSFAEFVITTLNQLSSVDEIQTFGSKQIRLTEIAMDRLDQSTLSGSVDLTDPLTLLTLSVFQILLVACYQTCVLSSHDLSIIGADQALWRVSSSLLQYLLNGGFEPVQQIIRKMRARNAKEDELRCDSILLDVWATLYHILRISNEVSSENIPSFWPLLQSKLGIDVNSDGEILDRIWYILMNISAITVVDINGIARSPSNRSKETTSEAAWNIVEAVVNPFLQSYSTVQSHRYDAYIRILFGRCHTLISIWGWSHGAKTILTMFYNFFVDRRFDNLKTEAFGGFPTFFQTSQPLEIHPVDNTFVIFLKLLVSYIIQQQTYNSKPGLSRREMLAGIKDLDRFVNRVTPLRTYQSTFAPFDYIALQNHYCLLLTLYSVAPRPVETECEQDQRCN